MTPEQKELVIRLWNSYPHPRPRKRFAPNELVEGSANWIARKVSVSRCAVSGVIYRARATGRLVRGSQGEPYKPRTDY